MKKNPIPTLLEARDIYLVPLTTDHYSEEYVSWLNDSLVCRENRHGVFPYTREDLKRYLNDVNKNNHAIHLAIHSKTSKKHIGNLGLINIVWVDHSIELAILIGDKTFWGKGLGEQAMRVAVDYCFKRLNMHRVWMGMTVSNVPMIKIAKKIGLKQEGLFKDYMFKNGRYVDVCQWAIINPKN